MAAVETLTAATGSPRPLRMGAATHRTPGSFSEVQGVAPGPCGEELLPEAGEVAQGVGGAFEPRGKGHGPPLLRQESEKGLAQGGGLGGEAAPDLAGEKELPFPRHLVNVDHFLPVQDRQVDGLQGGVPQGPRWGRARLGRWRLP